MFELMRISMRSTIFFLIFVITNNLLWLHLIKDNTKLYHQKQLLNDISSENDCDINCDKEKKHKILTQDIPTAESNILDVKSTDTNTVIIRECDDENNIYDQESPFAYATFDIDIPMEYSQDFLYEQAINREEYFSFANPEKKLDIIQSLSAQGDDLELIREILKTEDDSNIRVAALTRLNHAHSFAATNTLIKALDDPVEEVALTALNTIVINGDRSLLPLLSEKINLMSDTPIRSEYEKLINRLKYSVTMGMDGIIIE